ncbi:DDE-type integrase/transposase/recombinase [Bacillus sp. AC79A.1]|nr:DDE-type integrase/transposase/recombinase [Bacillus wiedmannii]
MYCAIDLKSNTFGFYLRKTRNPKAVKRFFKKVLQSFHVSSLYHNW